MSRQDRVGYGLSATIDGNPATVLYSPPVNEVTGGMERETMEDEETTGTRAPVLEEYGGRLYKKTISKSVRPVSVGPLLTALYGPPVTTQPAVTTSPNVYQHVWDFLGAPQFLALWTVNRDVSPVIVDKYIGGLGNSLELTVETNNYLKSEAEVFFRDLIQNAVEPAFTQDAGRKFPFTQITAQISVAGGALATIPLKEWGFKFDHDLADDEFVLGSNLVDGIPFGPEASGEATFRPRRDIDQWYRRALADTPELCRYLDPVVVGSVDGWSRAAQ